VWNAYVATKVCYYHILYYQKHQYIGPYFQGNTAMRPFRNKGWDYLTQMEAIIPVSGAKGHYAFAAATSSAQMITDHSDGEEEDLPDAIKAAGSSKAGAVGNVGAVDGDGDGTVEGTMEIDQFLIRASVSSSSKRKHTLLDPGTDSLPSSHAMSAPTTVASSEPASKKHNSSKGKQPAGKATMISSSSAAHKTKTSAARTAKVTQTTILHGMQGTMNRVTDIFERSVTQPVDPQAGVQDEALDLLQTHEDSLSVAEQRKLVMLFMNDVVIAQTYTRLVNEELRRSWIADMLERE